jgi:hypothetical protein
MPPTTIRNNSNNLEKLFNNLLRIVSAESLNTRFWALGLRQKTRSRPEVGDPSRATVFLKTIAVVKALS